MSLFGSFRPKVKNLDLSIKRWSVHGQRVSIAFPRVSPRITSTIFADRFRGHSLVSMATQDSRSILFTNTNPQQGFRLLELTPELEKLLTSKDAPT
jgi:hypothetical protein